MCVRQRPLREAKKEEAKPKAEKKEEAKPAAAADAKPAGAISAKQVKEIRDKTGAGMMVGLCTS